MANRPRWIKADCFYSDVQRTVDRMFFFKPDETIRQIIGSSAGRAQARFPVHIYWIVFNSNHKHVSIAPQSNAAEDIQNVTRFHQMFNSLVAKNINKYLGREGALYSTPNRSTEVLDNPSLEQQLFYALTNVVKDELVDRVADWKGFSTWKQMTTGEIERYRYIDYKAWKQAGGDASGKRPEAYMATTTIQITPLPQWQKMAPHQIEAKLRHETREIEQACRKQRESEDRKVMGPVKLAKQDHRDKPKTRPKRTKQPLCHSSSEAKYFEYKAAHGSFLEQYYAASKKWIQGTYDVAFPRGSFKPPYPKAAT